MAVASPYLVDKSAWEQQRYDERARRRATELQSTGQFSVCVVSLAEILYSARSAAEFARVRDLLSPLPHLGVTSAAESQVIDLMAALAARGQHRMPIPDLLLAAIAQAHGAVVLHYDADFERIAEVTGQRQEWIVPRGTGHGAGSRGTPS